MLLRRLCQFETEKNRRRYTTYYTYTYTHVYKYNKAEGTRTFRTFGTRKPTIEIRFQDRQIIDTVGAKPVNLRDKTICRIVPGVFGNLCDRPKTL